MALDSTIDFIDSPKTAQLLEKFEEEIVNGQLNVLCFRSGLKFDLFGMDNFAGAPFFMLHNEDERWSVFDFLLTDPVLQTDRLSMNWFCLAYRYSSEYLKQYREEIFHNTRAILNQIPARLMADNSTYRITPFEESADVAFIDIKVSGPFHKIRAAALVGGTLYLKSMRAGLPIFYRRSLGFHHPNFGILFDEHCSSTRLTVGLDPSQIDLFIECFRMIDELNGSTEN